MTISGVNFIWDISLGQVVQAVAFVASIYGAAMRMYHLFDKRLSILEVGLKEHSTSLKESATRMDRYEEHVMEIVRDLQRVIGRMEIWNERRSERRRPPTS